MIDMFVVLCMFLIDCLLDGSPWYQIYFVRMEEWA
jgi:hypothetical protein